MRIAQISENEFEPFLGLMADTECGSQFNADDSKHMAWLRRRISIKFITGTTFLGCYEDDAPVGFAAYLVDEGPEGITYLTKKCELTNIAIFPEHQRMGYGTALLSEVERAAREKGIYCLFMSSAATDRRAISFYGKNGYVPVGALPDVHGAGEEGIVFMRKTLKG